MLHQPKVNKDAITTGLGNATGTAVQWTVNSDGNESGWLHLASPDTIGEAAKALKELKARLAMITAYTEERDDPKLRRSIAYHFILSTYAFTVTIPTYKADSGEALEIESITPYFPNADWNEREFIEMFGIKIKNHPNKKRLFLDARIDEGVMAELIPFSQMANSAAGRNLWEQVMQAKGIDISGHVEDEAVANIAMQATAEPTSEPKVTPVSPVATEKPKVDTGVSVTEQKTQAAEKSVAAPTADVQEGVSAKTHQPAKEEKTATAEHSNVIQLKKQAPQEPQVTGDTVTPSDGASVTDKNTKEPQAVSANTKAKPSPAANKKETPKKTGKK